MPLDSELELTAETAHLDEAHIGHINGALGTIHRDDTGHRHTWLARGKTLLAIVGPGLIVMVGDNDAGAFGTYTQAGQNYGTTLLWNLLILIPGLMSTRRWYSAWAPLPALGMRGSFWNASANWARSASSIFSC